MTSPANDETTPLDAERRLINEARREARRYEPKEHLPKSIGPYEIIQSHLAARWRKSRFTTAATRAGSSVRDRCRQHLGIRLPRRR